MLFHFSQQTITLLYVLTPVSLLIANSNVDLVSILFVYRLNN